MGNKYQDQHKGGVAVGNVLCPMSRNVDHKGLGRKYACAVGHHVIKIARQVAKVGVTLTSENRC